MGDRSQLFDIEGAVRVLLPYLPGFVGAVIGLRFVEQLSTRGRVTAVAVGLASAVYLGPALGHLLGFLLLRSDPPIQVMGGIQFLTGLCAMSALPPFIKWISRVAGDPTILLSFLARRPPDIEPGGEP